MTTSRELSEQLALAVYIVSIVIILLYCFFLFVLVLLILASAEFPNLKPEVEAVSLFCLRAHSGLLYAIFIPHLTRASFLTLELFKW